MIPLSHAPASFPCIFVPQAIYEGVTIVGLCGVPSLVLLRSSHHVLHVRIHRPVHPVAVAVALPVLPAAQPEPVAVPLEPTPPTPVLLPDPPVVPAPTPVLPPFVKVSVHVVVSLKVLVKDRVHDEPPPPTVMVLAGAVI